MKQNGPLKPRTLMVVSRLVVARGLPERVAFSELPVLTTFLTLYDIVLFGIDRAVAI